jgi:hypothetical protein
MTILLDTYYNATELKKDYPALFVGMKNPRGIIDKYNIPKDKYGYYYVKDNHYVESENKMLKMKMELMKKDAEIIRLTNK